MCFSFSGWLIGAGRLAFVSMNVTPWIPAKNLLQLWTVPELSSTSLTPY
jgi:hypothetical protein